MGVFVLDYLVVSASTLDLNSVIGAFLTARIQLMGQRRRTEEEASVAAIDVIFDDLGVEHAHPYQRGMNYPVGSDPALRAGPDADVHMRADMHAQEGGGGRSGNDFVGAGRIGFSSRSDGHAILSGILPILACNQFNLGEEDGSKTAARSECGATVGVCAADPFYVG